MSSTDECAVNTMTGSVTVPRIVLNRRQTSTPSSRGIAQVQEEQVRLMFGDHAQGDLAVAGRHRAVSLGFEHPHQQTLHLWVVVDHADQRSRRLARAGLVHVTVPPPTGCGPARSIPIPP